MTQAASLASKTGSRRRSLDGLRECFALIVLLRLPLSDRPFARFAIFR